MGRQVVVILISFCLGRLTTLKENIDIWWIPNWIQIGFLQTGFFGALIVIILGHLVPQVIAAENPVQFLNIGGVRFQLMRFILYFTLFIEWTGIIHAVWVISRGISNLLFYFSIFKSIDTSPQISGIIKLISPDSLPSMTFPVQNIQNIQKENEMNNVVEIINVENIEPPNIKLNQEIDII